MISQIINNENNPIPVKNQKSIGEKFIANSRVGDLAIGAEELVLNNNVPTVVDFLEFATSSYTAQLIIRGKVGAETVSIGQINIDGTATSGFTPQLIENNLPSFLEINSFDKTNNKYKFTIKEPMYFPEGVQIGVKSNAQSTVIKAGIRFHGRELK